MTLEVYEQALRVLFYEYVYSRFGRFCQYGVPRLRQIILGKLIPTRMWNSDRSGKRLHQTVLACFALLEDTEALLSQAPPRNRIVVKHAGVRGETGQNNR